MVVRLSYDNLTGSSPEKSTVLCRASVELIVDRCPLTRHRRFESSRAFFSYRKILQ
jgi:hypothetical protein